MPDLPDGRSASPRAPVRRGSIDGLRGFAYLWVVAGHFWIIVPHADTARIPLVGWVFEAGNRGVSIFLVLAGFFAGRSLLAYRGADQLRRSCWWLVRRILRVVLAVIPLLAAVVMVQALEQPDPFPGADTASSIVAILTQSWNFFLIEAPLQARPDLGHLWYISVYAQVIIALAAVFVVTRGRLALTLPILVAALVAVSVVRAQAVADHGLYASLLMTTTRADGIVWGVLLAVVVDRLRVSARRVDLLAAAAAALLVLLAWTATAENYFQWPGIVNNLVVCALVVAAWRATPSHWLGRVLDARVSHAIGVRALTIYVWHYPLFWLISRHTHDWSHLERSAFALATLAVVVEFVHRQWDEPMRVWIGRRFSSRPAS